MSALPQVLDPCCGGRMFYFDKADPLVHFCDNRQEQHTLCDGRVFTVSPDTVCDFRNLPFDDEQFNLVVFDPPHLLNAGEQSWMKAKYGTLPKDFKPYLKAGFNECWRVLKTGGTLVFKWNEIQVPVKEIVKLAPIKPLLGHRSGKQQLTHWLLFYKALSIIDKEIYK